MISTAVLSILFFFMFFHIIFILPTKWLKVEKVVHDMGLHIKIMHISDLHMEKLRILPKQIERKISKYEPDYIMLTGDFLNNYNSIDKLKSYLSIFNDSSIPTFAVLGNHDYYLGDTSLLIKTLKSFNITVLINESISLSDFELVGIDDFCSEKHDIQSSFKDLSVEKKRIVITHDPNIITILDKKFDYLLAGHLHGKQFNIPFLFKINPMGDLPNMGIYKGLHRFNNKSFYISKGIGQSGFNLRLFVRSEITIHFL